MCVYKDQTITSKSITQQPNFESLYSMFANHHSCIVLSFNVCCIGNLNSLKFIHKFTCTVTFKIVPMFLIWKFGESPNSDCMLDRRGINLVTF